MDFQSNNTKIGGTQDFLELLLREVAEEIYEMRLRVDGRIDNHCKKCLVIFETELLKLHENLNNLIRDKNVNYSFNPKSYSEEEVNQSTKPIRKINIDIRSKIESNVFSTLPTELSSKEFSSSTEDLASDTPSGEKQNDTCSNAKEINSKASLSKRISMCKILNFFNSETSLNSTKTKQSPEEPLKCEEAELICDKKKDGSLNELKKTRRSNSRKKFSVEKFVESTSFLTLENEWIDMKELPKATKQHSYSSDVSFKSDESYRMENSQKSLSEVKTEYFESSSDHSDDEEIRVPIRPSSNYILSLMSSMSKISLSAIRAELVDVKNKDFIDLKACLNAHKSI